MPHFDEWDDLENHLKGSGEVLKAASPYLPGDGVPFGLPSETGSLTLYRAIPARAWDMRTGTDDDGLSIVRSEITVTPRLLQKMNEEFSKETSAVRRMSATPITRAFVYLDISDFSTMPAGVQLLVVLALVRIAQKVQGLWPEMKAEAELCIGDGYIYAFTEAGNAARFAGNLAVEIEKAVAEPGTPEFHFRIGAHVGLVRCFWDPGRKSWNYVGHGINGGNRVLSAIGKDTDDVVFFSGQLRSAIMNCGTAAAELVKDLHNRGRRPDKHKQHWRVYELNHSARKYF